MDAIDPEALTPEDTRAELAQAIAEERESWLDPRRDGAHESFRLHAPAEDEIERVWQTYWLPTLRGEDGKVSLERLKAELYDACFLVDQARRVYHHVTGGLTDDLTASADGIIALADRRIEDLTRGLREALEDAKGEARQWLIRCEKARNAVLAARRLVRAIDAAGGPEAVLGALDDTIEAADALGGWLDELPDESRKREAAVATTRALRATLAESLDELRRLAFAVEGV